MPDIGTGIGVGIDRYSTFSWSAWWASDPYPDGTIVRNHYGKGLEYSNPTLNINQYYANRTPAKLDFPTVPLGDNTAIHPDVLDFYNETGSEWNGYRFWMSYTPLPQVNPNDHEVPCVLVSNDKITWIVPAGGHNPITTHVEVAYMSDPDLFYDRLTKRLWLIYSNYISKKIVGKYTTNGIDWSSEVEIYDYVNLYASTSPALIKVGNQYRLYIVYYIAPANPYVYCLTATSIIGPWANIGNIVFDDTHCNLGGLILPALWYPWHINMIKIVDFYIMCLYPRLNADYPKEQMWLAVSSDGINFTIARASLFQSNYENTYWDAGMYRFTITPEIIDNKLAFNCWYSGWAHQGDVYPVYIGYTLIKNFDEYIISNTDNQFNTIPYNAELAKAVALEDNYVLGDTFSRIQTAGYGLGDSDSGYTYLYGAYNHFRINNGYAYAADLTQFPEYFIDLNKDYEWSFDILNPDYTNYIYLKYIDADNFIAVYGTYAATVTFVFRKLAVNTQTSYNKYRVDATRINRYKFSFNGAKVQLYINEVFVFERTFVLGDFANQAQMDSFINCTKKGMQFRQLTTKLYSQTLKVL